MKKFRINVVSVNDGTYEVEVEEIGGSATPSAVRPVSKAAPEPTPKAAPTPIAVPAPKAAPAPKSAAPAPGGAEVIVAPVPGIITSIKVKPGQQVQAGDLVVVMEALKMENEIFCNQAGTVKEINCNEGAEVNPGDVLIVIG